MSLPTDRQYAVVVATYNRGAKIRPLLESMQRSHLPNFEMVIVDQSPNDETRRAVEPFLADPRIRYVHSAVAGTSRARNRGFALTSAPIIAITDDDCIVPSDWLARIARPFEVHPKVGVVYCCVVPVPEDRPGHTPNIRFSANRAIRAINEIRPAQRLWMGAGMAIRRKMLEDVQGFDEVLGPGSRFPACEDNDIAWRGLVQGWWTYESADVSVLHNGFRSLDQLPQQVMRDFYGIGGTLAKYVKTGHFHVGAMLIPLIYQFGLVEPLRDIFSRRIPRGFRRPYMLLRGFRDGLRTPLNHATLCYRRDSNVAQES